MSQTNNDLAFRKRADAFIQLANRQTDQEKSDYVNASLLYAGARFSAFLVASGSDNIEAMKTNREQAITYFTDQFNKMLIENLDEHIQNFDQYMQIADDA
jgi:hypothetical protein